MLHYQQSFIRMSDRKLWTPQQDHIILQLIKQYGTTQWTTIAEHMRHQTVHPRTSKQIRQRWHNQLNPQIQRSAWNDEQENVLFAVHAEVGNKWKEIAMRLPGRTDNAVKNHFYSTIRRALRRLDKHYGYRDSTRKMRNLKPAALTHLLETSQHCPDFAETMEMLRKFAQEKPSRKDKKRQGDESGKMLYERILSMISQFNEGYQRGGRSVSEKQKIKGAEDMMGLEEVEDEKQLLSSGVPSLDDQLSIVSVGSASKDSLISNYFGSIGETGSWFNVNERQPQVGLLQGNLLVIGLEGNQFQ